MGLFGGSKDKKPAEKQKQIPCLNDEFQAEYKAYLAQRERNSDVFLEAIISNYLEFTLANDIFMKKYVSEIAMGGNYCTVFINIANSLTDNICQILTQEIKSNSTSAKISSVPKVTMLKKIRTDLFSETDTILNEYYQSLSAQGVSFAQSGNDILKGAFLGGILNNGRSAGSQISGSLLGGVFGIASEMNKAAKLMDNLSKINISFQNRYVESIYNSVENIIDYYISITKGGKSVSKLVKDDCAVFQNEVYPIYKRLLNTTRMFYNLIFKVSGAEKLTCLD